MVDLKKHVGEGVTAVAMSAGYLHRYVSGCHPYTIAFKRFVGTNL